MLYTEDTDGQLARHASKTPEIHNDYNADAGRLFGLRAPPRRPSGISQAADTDDIEPQLITEHSIFEFHSDDEPPTKRSRQRAPSEENY